MSFSFEHQQNHKDIINKKEKVKDHQLMNYSFSEEENEQQKENSMYFKVVCFY